MTDVTKHASLVDEALVRYGRVPRSERDDLRQDVWVSLLEAPDPDPGVDETLYLEFIIRDSIVQQNKLYNARIKGHSPVVSPSEVDFDNLEPLVKLLSYSDQILLRKLFGGYKIKTLATELSCTKQHILSERNRLINELRVLREMEQACQ